MGKRILDYFEQANLLGGLVARMRLASLAQVTSTEAPTLADTPEVIERLERALETVRQQFPQAGQPKPREALREPSAEDRTPILRRYLQCFLDLMSQRAVLLGNVDGTVRRVTETASSVLGVQRVSVWWCNDKTTKISCADLFDQKTGQHSAGVELLAKDFSPYFRALATERTIAANDAHLDPRTDCFSESYLKPLGITSLLDVPIWVQKRMVGVLCHEHVGPKRRWDTDEETFAYLMSSFIALAMERA